MEENKNLPVQGGTDVPQKQLGLKDLMNSDYVKKRFNEIMGKNASGFIASVINTAMRPELKDCDSNSILSASIVAATLNFPIDPNLGFAAIVPFNNKQKDGSYKKICQFQIMYKGLIQLCLRSNQVVTINVSKIYEGQISERNIVTGEIKFDEKGKKSDKVVGYVAYLKLINGFEKMLYSTVEEIKAHGKKYSKSFSNEFGLWNKDFDAMAQKTVLKNLLSKYSPMSIEMQNAVKYDQAIATTDENLNLNEPEYSDNPMEIQEVTTTNEALESKFNDSAPATEQVKEEPAKSEAEPTEAKGKKGEKGKLF